MTELTTLQKALYTIKKLKESLRQQQTLPQPIAIVGLSCRFPEAMDKAAYWQLLSAGKHAVSSMPEQRWQLLKGTREEALRDKTFNYWGSYLSDIDLFDAYFFGITPREALLMDPQQRWLLEVAYEAIEDAGLPLETLAGSNTGVFAGLDASQFSHLQKLDAGLDALYLPTGNATSIAANRISYFFDLHGPSMVVDTACSASLVAAHLACLNLQHKVCDVALVCTANINFLPIINLILSKATMLSPDGKCKPFDAAANGYAAGEGVGVLVLKPLDKAIENKDRIYAVIEGSAVNQDGATNGLTAPNGLQQERLIKSVYAGANINPNQISYVECHGTGTFLGDPIEIEALGEAISQNRTAENPCWIGSVKANIGHLEPSAGIASLIKVALSLQAKKIPPQIHFSTPNPYIDFNKYHLCVPKKLEQWPKYGLSRIAGVSGFGFGGTNAHVVLREVLEEEKITHVAFNIARPELFTLSAKNQAALRGLVEKWCDYLAGNLELDIAQLCYNLHVRRSHYAFRVAIIAPATNALYNSLCVLRKNFSGNDEDIFLTEMTNHSATKNKTFVDLSQIQNLKQLAVQYIHQANIDWQQYESHRSYLHCDMPLYAWQHKHYWPELLQASEERSNVSVNPYPLKGQQISSPLETIQFAFEFSAKSMPEIGDTHNIIHAGYYVEMLAFSASRLGQQRGFTIEDLVFSSPLTVSDDGVLNVQLVMERLPNDKIKFSFYSAQKDQVHWIKHADGILLLTSSPGKFVQMAAIKQRCAVEKDAKLFYDRIANLGLPTGKSIRWLHRCWLGKNEILCEFRQPDMMHQNEEFALQVHPGIIDASIQPVFMLLPPQMNKAFIAAQVGKLKYNMVSSTKFYLLASLKEMSPAGDKMRVDWCLMNQDSRIVAECENIFLTRIDNKIDMQKIIPTQDSLGLDLSGLSSADQALQITDYLLEKISVIFSMPKEDIDVSESLQKMGMDSLMALVLMRVIDVGFGMTYSVQDILQGASIRKIVDDVMAHYQPSEMQSSIAQQTMSEKKVNPWIAYRQRQKNPKIRLFCFPYGGGGASIYRQWQQGLPDFIEVCPIQLPGREERMEENAIDDIDTLIYQLIENLQSELDVPFAFFGHSFGSLIAFALTRYLRQHQLPLPQHLFVSAYPDPRIQSKSLDKLLQQLHAMNFELFDLNRQSVSLLSDEALIKLARLFNENGVFEYSDHLISPDIMRIILPIFAQDMRIVKSYFYRDESPLGVPITVFLGQRDTWVSYVDHLGWAAHTQKRCKVYEFNSGHLFIRENACQKEMLQVIEKTFEVNLPAAELLS